MDIPTLSGFPFPFRSIAGNVILCLVIVLISPFVVVYAFVKYFFAISTERHLSPATLILTFLTIAASVVWLVASILSLNPPIYLEPMTTTLGLIAAFGGFIIDPQLEQAKLKQQHLRSVEQEVRINSVLLDAVRQAASQIREGGLVYPRLRSSSMSDALTSGCLASDAEIHALIAQTSVDIEGLNAMFQQTEIRMLFVGNLENKQQLHANMIGESTSFDRTDVLLKQLQMVLENRNFACRSPRSIP